MLPQFPLYIPSKGRWQTCFTMRCLDKLGVPYRVVVEDKEHDAYAAALGESRLLVLDPSYQRDYVTYDDLGDAKSKGAGPARNFIWDHATAEGHAWHWVMDDNITKFHRLNRNLRLAVADGTIFRAMEDFCLRYTNVAMAGPHYYMFIPRREKFPPFFLNTRVYSCNLIRNDVPFRWQGRYNEDTDLSLRVLKAGWCTILFCAFLQHKLRTQTVKGGNTAEFYDKDGRMPNVQMLVDQHPDVARYKWRFGRPHHYVDYSGFKQPLVRRPDVVKPAGVNEYGMAIVQGRSAAADPQARRVAPKVRSTTGHRQEGPVQAFDDDGESMPAHAFSKGGGVPGGHYLLLSSKSGKPFVPPTKEMRAVPLRHSDVVVDIGAYCGTYAIMCARHPVKRVVAYEPTPGTFRVLSKTQLPNMELRHAAVVGDDRTEVELYLAEGNGITNRVWKPYAHTGRAVRVAAVNYAEAVRGASVVKIDVEGAEYDYPLVQPSLRAILIDFHPRPGKWTDEADRIMEGFERAGFEAVVRPDWSCGWTRAAAFVRDLPDDGSGFTPMLSGELCCGCGAPIAAGGKGLCPTCWGSWAPRHRKGFALGHASGPERGA